MTRFLIIVAPLAAALFMFVPAQARAQSSTNYTASNQWGTYSSGISVTGEVDSAVAHNQNGAAAAEVNAAKLGALIGNGAASTINAIGSETIVNTSIIGNGDIATISATQTSTNSGAVKNGGQIGQTNLGNTIN